MFEFFKKVKNSIKYWYLMLIVGIIFIILGVLVFATPLESYVTLAYVFGFSILLAGLLEFIFSIANRKEIDGWGWHLSFGILNMLFGILLMKHIGNTMAMLPFFIGFLVMFRSINAISNAFELKNYGVMDWGNLLGLGILGLLFSFFMVWNPIFSGTLLVVWAGLGFLTIGFYAVYFSFKLRKLKKIGEDIRDDLKDKFDEVKKEIVEELNK